MNYDPAVRFDIYAERRLPLPEVVELNQEDGEKQWNLAVALQEAFLRKQREGEWE